MSPITVSVMRLFFVVSTALVFFAGYQFGRDHIEHPDCPSIKSSVIQSIADIKRSSAAAATAGAIPPGGVLITAAPPTNCDKPPHTTTNAISSHQEDSREIADSQKPWLAATCPKPAEEENLWTLHMGRATVPDDIFSYLHHPGPPAKYGYFMSRQAANWDKTVVQVKDMPCSEIYLTRTGSRASQPNKCVAVLPVPDGYASHVHQSHRKGFTALNTDQYQQDYPRNYHSTMNSEPALLRPLLENLPELIQMMRSLLGDRPHATVMVANKGVLDLLLNFVCSAEAAGIDLASVVVFVGDEQMVSVVKDMGIAAVFAPALGAMPTQAAGSYLDGTFSRMMWFKAAAVYVTLMAGYEVLFQDVDLVWLINPMEFFAAQPHYDLFFMDDGARTPRYTPFFVNSGFYFVKHNVRTVYLFEKLMKAAAAEIGQTHSHQSVLIRHIAESVHLFSVSVLVLDMDQFPSGQAYHENKGFVKKVQARTFRPFVFHMCWTDNRENKLVYFKDVGLWLVSENNPQCLVNNIPQNSHQNLLNLCCQRNKYWPPPTAQDFALTSNVTVVREEMMLKKRAQELKNDANFWKRQEQNRLKEAAKKAKFASNQKDVDEDDDDDDNNNTANSGVISQKSKDIADDGEADDKLDEESGDLSKLKAEKQKLKLAQQKLKEETDTGNTENAVKISVVANSEKLKRIAVEHQLSTENKKVVVEEEDAEEGYGAKVPLESFDKPANNIKSKGLAKEEEEDAEEGYGAKVPLESFDKPANSVEGTKEKHLVLEEEGDDNDDNDDDDNDGDDDKYDDDKIVSSTK